jgi:arylsulfatase A-like enzyme
METAVLTEEVHLVGGYGLEDGYQARIARRMGASDEERTVTNRFFGHAGFLYSPRMRTLLERLPGLAVPVSALNFQQEAAFKREVCSDFVNGEFDSWLAHRDGGRPFHAFFNFVDGHEPYPALAPRPIWLRTPDGFVQVPRYYLLSVPGLKERVPWEQVEAAYLAAIAEGDRKVGHVLAALEKNGELDRTLVIVTADHGQSLGETGTVYHGCGASDAVLRVPLVVAGPGVPSGGPPIESWVSLCEIPSWLKSSALGREPFGPEGIAPVPFPARPGDPSTVLAEGGPASDPNRSLHGIGMDHRWNHRLVAAYRRDRKWVWDLFSGELWRWVTEGRDPDGQHPDALQGEERMEALEDVFRVHTAADAERFRGITGAQEREPLGDARMRSWGYD